MSENYFADLNKVDLSKQMERKGQFSYLSWANAVTELGLRHPKATWSVRRFPMVTEGWVVHSEIEVPYLQTPCGFFVEVAVTVEGVIKTQVHPILDHRNKPVKGPDSFQVNTSIQRCLAKAIALHGLSLHIFAGEDLPKVDASEQISPDPIDHDKVKKCVLQALDIMDNEDPEMITTPKDSRELYEPLTSDERMAFQTELKTHPVGRKTAWSIFKEYLALAA